MNMKKKRKKGRVIEKRGEEETKSMPHAPVYFETGWEPLHSRRHHRKLKLFCKIHNNDSHYTFLYDCLVPYIREEN